MKQIEGRIQTLCMKSMYPPGKHYSWTTYHQTAAAQLTQNGPTNTAQLQNVMVPGPLLTLHPQPTESM